MKVMIVDDEPLSRLGIVSRLASHQDMSVIGECESGEQAMELIPRLKPDLLFLDIQMPGISGMDLLRITKPSDNLSVVLLTAYQDHALEAFALNVLDYLLKPIDDERFQQTIERVRRITLLRQHGVLFERINGLFDVRDNTVTSRFAERFALHTGKKMRVIRAKEIDWIEGCGDYVGLHVAGQVHLLHETLTAMERQLSPFDFLRIHRSTIVQVDRIVKIDLLPNLDSSVTLREGVVLRGSRTYGRAVRDLLRERRVSFTLNDGVIKTGSPLVDE